MKKIIIFILICYALVLFTGCGTASYIEDTFISSENIIADTDGAAHKSPPQKISFQTIEQFQTFSNAESLSEKDADQYLEQRTFGIDGIESKEDMVSISKKLKPVLIPVVDGYRITSFYYTPESNRFFIHYENDESETITFSRRFDKEEAEKYTKNVDSLVAHRFDQEYQIHKAAVASDEYFAYRITYPDFIAVLKLFFIEEEKANDIVSNQLTFASLNEVALNPDMWAPEE